MTTGAATVAIATQANFEGATSCFCPAGVHMGKCRQMSEIIAKSRLAEALVSEDNVDKSPLLNANMENVFKWVPPDLPLPATVHSRAIFSPTFSHFSMPPYSPSGQLPNAQISVSIESTPEAQESSPKADQDIGTVLVDPSVGIFGDDKIPAHSQSTNQLEENVEVSYDLTLRDDVDLLDQLPNVEKLIPENEDKSVSSQDTEQSSVHKSPQYVDAGKVEIGEPEAVRADETNGESGFDVSLSIKGLTSSNGEQVGTDEAPNITPKRKLTPPVPSRPKFRKSDIPTFYIPLGRSLKPASEIDAELDCIKSKIDLIRPSDDLNAQENEKGTTINSQSIPYSSFGMVTKACGCPLYWKKGLFSACGGQNDETVTIEDILKTWRRVLESCADEAARFVYILSNGKSHFLEPEDFRGVVQDVVETHPSLSFLQSARDFHSRYVTTIIARIFFSVNSSWSGRISLGELRRSNFLSVLSSLETVDDINLVTQYFSYEHFYVIYCKFWELDTDHDLIISKSDLARHSEYALSTSIIERIFSGAVTRGNSLRDGTMTYSEFVWFLLAEEDKRHPRSIEYWFRCMDLDGDGLLSLFELEHFYKEQIARMDDLGMASPCLEDCLCQCLDMVKPVLVDKIRLSDLKRCKMCAVFFNTFFNLKKYLQYEQRDPFENTNENDDDLTEVSDWDRYASDAYDMLVASENGNQDTSGVGGLDDDEVTGDDDMSENEFGLEALTEYLPEFDMPNILSIQNETESEKNSTKLEEDV